MGEHDFERVEILTGPGSCDVQEGDVPACAGPCEALGEPVGVQPGQNQEVADVQNARGGSSTGSRSAATKPALAPTQWMNRRSWPRTLTTSVWLVASADRSSARASTPRDSSVSVAKRPKMSSPTRAQTAARDAEPGEIDGGVGGPAADVQDQLVDRRPARRTAANDRAAARVVGDDQAGTDDGARVAEFAVEDGRQLRQGPRMQECPGTFRVMRKRCLSAWTATLVLTRAVGFSSGCRSRRRSRLPIGTSAARPRRSPACRSSPRSRRR